MIGVGLEEEGVQEFVDGKFFDGELYIDTKKECYKKMGFKRFNFFNVFPAVFSKNARDSANQAKEQNISGNFKGDGMQNGGTLVVKKGGELLLRWNQENPADHVPLQDVLNALNIKESIPTSENEPELVCDDNSCEIE
ncbi:prostamide/prostaglandin F synthase-like [Tubulanus polymorphus]|uniref:prostamide/prostaglandin F synthase-like n=1 Tax=Tubulanus polymorphus TaxID=672921 RepID=UPI003DA2DDCA